MVRNLYLTGLNFFVKKCDLNPGRKSGMDPDSDDEKLPNRKFNVVMLKNYPVL
jgi:hypothetical protein